VVHRLQVAPLVERRPPGQLVDLGAQPGRQLRGGGLGVEPIGLGMLAPPLQDVRQPRPHHRDLPQVADRLGVGERFPGVLQGGVEILHQALGHRAQAQQAGADGVALGVLQLVGQPIDDHPHLVRVVDPLAQRGRVEDPRIVGQHLLRIRPPIAGCAGRFPTLADQLPHLMRYGWDSLRTRGVPP